MILLGVGKAAPQPIPIKCVGGKSPIVPGVCYSGGAGETLVVIEEDPVISKLAKPTGIKQELCGTKMHSAGIFVTNVKVTGEPTVLVVRSKFPAVNFTFTVIKGRKNECLPKLSLIQNIAGVFVETIDTKLQTVSYLLCHARIEVMGPLRFYWRVERDGGFVGRASKLRDRTLVDIFQGRRGKIARVTGMESRRRPRRVNNVDARAELTFGLDRLGNVDPAAKIDGQLLKWLPLILQVKASEVSV